MSWGKLSESGNEWILEKETRNKKKKREKKNNNIPTLSVWSPHFCLEECGGSGWAPGPHWSGWLRSHYTGPVGQREGHSGSHTQAWAADSAGSVRSSAERPTLILRGPSRSPLFLLGVSMVMTLSSPRSKLPNTFPPFRFWALSLWQPAMSSERDLGGEEREMQGFAF